MNDQPKDIVAKLYTKDLKKVVFGNHPGIIQSMLDFDFMNSCSEPSVRAIIGVQQQHLRYFFGKKEVMIACYASAQDVPADVQATIGLFLVVQSARRVVSVCEEALECFPQLLGGSIFAEGVPERHSLYLQKLAQRRRIFILGPASVGLLVAGFTKLGAIGGVKPLQLATARILKPGSVAVISTSGGMVNELITMVTKSGAGVSFAAAVGGDRYPVTSATALVQAAYADDRTKAVVLFGELGGFDEYETAKFLTAAGNKKPVVCYVAGSIGERFERSPQFGHAKAMAETEHETASAKKAALRAAGAQVAESFAQFEQFVSNFDVDKNNAPEAQTMEDAMQIETRKQALFTSTVSSDAGGTVKVLGEDLVQFVSDKSLSKVALSMFLGKVPKSEKLCQFFDTSLRLLVDHGPQVSGAVTTMITARAGKDLTASLASGLLTIGPRFGGAINQSALFWFEAVQTGETSQAFVERLASSKQYIPGIGHKKYSTNEPDPRVAKLQADFGVNGLYTQFALEVQKVTTAKKAQLILNVDGMIAALLLDILASDENYSPEEIKKLLDAEFCNAIFVYARTVGFIATFLDQKRLDEGLFRLPDDEIVALQ